MQQRSEVSENQACLVHVSESFKPARVVLLVLVGLVPGTLLLLLLGTGTAKGPTTTVLVSACHCMHSSMSLSCAMRPISWERDSWKSLNPEP